MRLASLLLAVGLACAAPPPDAGAQDEPPPSGQRADPGADSASPDASHPAEAAELQPTTLLDRHDFGRRTGRFDLPGRLDEISGLAVSPDGRLFGHDDERARIHLIDPVAGEAGKRWDVGDEPVRGDFEGIAIVGERFFLVSSQGLLYEFREGQDRASVPYRVTDMGVGATCEVEGLDYDPVDDALLLACKVSVPDRGAIVVHRAPLDPTGPRLTPLTIPRGQLVAHGLGPEFDPSGIAVDPTGTLVLVSARQEAIVEVDRSGRVLAALRLSRSRHPQPEGIAFGADGTLYLADERSGRDARVTLYARVPPPAQGAGAP